MVDAWPGSLPQTALLNGYSESAPNTSIRSNMDVGPDKIRQRFTAGIRNFNINVSLSISQVETLDIFYVTTLTGGSLPFTWVHPRTGVGVTYRFIQPPTYAAAGNDRYFASMKLEILP